MFLIFKQRHINPCQTASGPLREGRMKRERGRSKEKQPPVGAGALEQEDEVKRPVKGLVTVNRSWSETKVRSEKRRGRRG